MIALYYIKKGSTYYNEEIEDIENYKSSLNSIITFQIIEYTEYSEKTINEISKNVTLFKTDCKEAAIAFAKIFNS